MAKNKVEINGINTSNLKVLTQEEMIELFKKRDKLSKDKLIEGNLKLVLSILKKYQKRCDNMDDLFQIGVIGLIKSIDNFDLSFNVKFSTYAVFMIEGEIKRYIRDNTSIRISRSIKELSYEIVSYKENYIKEYQKYPSNDEICKKFNINDYELYMALNSLSDINSIFEPVFNDGNETIYLLDQLEDKSVKDLDSLIALREALSKISDRDKIVIEKRYIDGMSQSEIAEFLNISQAQVSRIETNALKCVKKLIL